MTTWVITVTLAAFSAGVFVIGVRRDARAGEPTLDVNLAAPSGWVSTPFRVWRSGRYRLFISTVNHDTDRIGRRFDGALEIVVRLPDGSVFYEHQFQGDRIAHAIPDNYGDTELALLDLNASRVRPWSFAVRITEPDTDFAGIRSQIKLWRQRDDPGLGGVVNYVMIIPAGLFAIAALLVSLSLARRGIRAPVVVTVLALGGFLLWATV